ncbi:MAG TPA: hypothetical protein VM122_13115, partial [Usitatibacter sp.]|nr:hypothetical protein [Usitatibacter sp.]
GLKKVPDLRKRVIKSALDFEKANPKRPVPTWICGQDTASRKPPAQKAFQALRDDVRKQFAEHF